MFALSLAMLALGGAPLQSPSSDQATIDAIIREGKDHSQVMKKLTELCTKFGPRLTGSPRLSASQQWAMAEFRKMGLKNVHLDEWGEVPVGFERGTNNSARLITPDKTEELIFTTNCWTNGTNGVVRAEAVLCPETVEALDAARETLRGKWVVLPAPALTTPTGGGGFGGGQSRPTTPPRRRGARWWKHDDSAASRRTPGRPAGRSRQAANRGRRARKPQRARDHGRTLGGQELR